MHTRKSSMKPFIAPEEAKPPPGNSLNGYVALWAVTRFWKTVCWSSIGLYTTV